MIRVKNKFKELKQKKQKAFGVFLTAGYPSLEYSKDIFKKILESSDPMAVKLGIACVGPAHPAATMQWCRLWQHVVAHNEFFPGLWPF